MWLGYCAVGECNLEGEIAFAARSGVLRRTSAARRAEDLSAHICAHTAQLVIFFESHWLCSVPSCYLAYPNSVTKLATTQQNSRPKCDCMPAVTLITKFLMITHTQSEQSNPYHGWLEKRVLLNGTTSLETMLTPACGLTRAFVISWNQFNVNCRRKSDFTHKRYSELFYTPTGQL